MEAYADTFEALWAQTHTRLCWFICSRVGSEQDAEDLLQDVFLRAYRQMGTVHDPQRLESWIYQIARNRIIDHYRGQRQWVDLPETLISDEAAEEDGLMELLPHLCEAIGSLPEIDQRALNLVDLEGMSQQDLAGRLGISLSGAKSRVQRARQKVKEAMLHCLHLEFDARGQIMDYRQRCCC